MSKVLNAQREGRFEEIEERDKEIQSCIWAMLFLVSELALGFRALRDRLKERGVLLPEDEGLINDYVTKEETLHAAYAQVEQAFQDKYQRVRTAMDNPQAVTDHVNDKYGGTSIDLNDVSVKNTEAPQE